LVSSDGSEVLFGFWILTNVCVYGCMTLWYGGKMIIPYFKAVKLLKPSDAE